MTFLSAVRGVAADRRAIITLDGETIFGDLVATAEELRPTLDGARLLLSSNDVQTAVVLLLAADGVADAVAVISPAQDSASIGQLLPIVAPDCIIADRHLGTSTGERTIPSARTLAELGAQLRMSPRSQRSPSGRTQWIMTTSGTTGVPKLVGHNFSSLTRTTRCDVQKGFGQVWGLLYDYTRFAGLQVVLQSLLSGATLAVAPRVASLDVQLGFLAEVGCTHLSATPTLWRRILMSEVSSSLCLQQITLGGEIADDTVLRNLVRSYPTARISHIFASTEAGVGFSVTDRRAGFPVDYLQHPPAGIDLRIEAGRLWIRNPEVAATYLGEEGTLGCDGWVDTGDGVEVSNQRVYFRGRESGVINVGGKKVHPEQVEQALLEHPSVRLARVYSKRSPIIGELVTADVVAAADAGSNLQEKLLSHLKGRLERHMIPAVIRLVASLSTTPAGKIGRKT